MFMYGCTLYSILDARVEIHEEIIYFWIHKSFIQQ